MGNVPMPYKRLDWVRHNDCGHTGGRAYFLPLSGTRRVRTKRNCAGPTVTVDTVNVFSSFSSTSVLTVRLDSLDDLAAGASPRWRR
jgi:hypothetical protein